MDGFACRTCGGWHNGLPRIWGADAPAVYSDLSPPARRTAELNADQCIIQAENGPLFFLRGRLEIPVDDDAPFVWLVWVSLSEAAFTQASELWEHEGREHQPPYSGLLSDRLPYPEPTLMLEARVHTRPVGERPFIELTSTDHPLAREQREGITRKRVLEIAEHFMHPRAAAPR